MDQNNQQNNQGTMPGMNPTVAAPQTSMPTDPMGATPAPVTPEPMAPEPTAMPAQEPMAPAMPQETPATVAETPVAQVTDTAGQEGSNQGGQMPPQNPPTAASM